LDPWKQGYTSEEVEMSEVLQVRGTRSDHELIRDPSGPSVRAGLGPARSAAGSITPRPDTTIRRCRAFIAALAPAVAAAAHAYHPWIGSPGDADFLARLAAAVTADPVRWGISHFGVALGSGLIILAFMAVRGHLREAGEDRWSAIGLPFVVLGSLLYALLPAMEFAPLAAARVGADIAAIQAAQMAWFVPILMMAALLFFLGVIGFAVAIVRSHILSPRLAWLVVGALVVMALTRFFPVGAAQLHVGPAAGVVAHWPLAYVMARRR
jgi:hypothetical protein